MTYIYVGLITGLCLVIGVLLAQQSSTHKELKIALAEAATCKADLDTSNQINTQNAEEYAKLAQAKTLADIEASHVIEDGKREASILKAKLMEISNDKNDGPIPPNLQSTLDWVRQNAAAHP